MPQMYQLDYQFQSNPAIESLRRVREALVDIYILRNRLSGNLSLLHVLRTIRKQPAATLTILLCF